jgi:hypothetical protein
MSLAPQRSPSLGRRYARRRLPVGPRSILPKLREAVWGQGSVAHGMLNIAVPQVLSGRFRGARFADNDGWGGALMGLLAYAASRNVGLV